MKKHDFDRESGQTAVLFAMMIVVIIGMLALVIDYGMPARTARRLQNAADSAALAGATLLPAKGLLNAEPARKEAIAYAGKNGYTDVAVSFRKSSGAGITLPDSGGGTADGENYTIIDVTVKATVDYTFAKIFGHSSVELERSASAQVKAITSLRGVVPLSIKKDEMDAALASGNYYMTLKYGGGSGSNGAYGAIDLDGSNGGGASQYKDRLVNGYDGTISVGDLLPAENGNMSGPTESGVQQRYNACTHFPSAGGCTPTQYDKNCPRIMMIPVVVYTGAHTVEIQGFAPFLISSYHGSGNECFVYGSYLPSYITEGDVDPSAPENPYGPYTVKLVG